MDKVGGFGYVLDGKHVEGSIYKGPEGYCIEILDCRSGYIKDLKDVDAVGNCLFWGLIKESGDAATRKRYATT